MSISLTDYFVTFYTKVLKKKIKFRFLYFNFYSKISNQFIFFYQKENVSEIYKFSINFKFQII